MVANSLNSMQWLEYYLDHSPAVFFKWRNETGWPVEYVTTNVLNITGYSAQEFLDQSIRYDQLIHPDDLARVTEEVLSASTSTQTDITHAPYRIITKMGEMRWVSDTTKIKRESNGVITIYYGYIIDITEQILQQEHIQMMALRSSMTGLPNLYALVQDIETKDHPLLGIVNIDGFKILNNHYGYKTGDLIIQAIAHLLRGELEDGKIGVYHIHADEFGILANGYGYETFIQKLQAFQKHVHLHGFSFAGKSIPIHLSIASSNESKDRLLVSCNMAIHFARSHNEKFVRYEPTIDFSKDYDENIRWTSLLHEAIENDGIEPFFQPIYSMSDGSIRKYEALIRLRKDNEVFTPFFFLEIAKKVKLYPEISLMMLEKTFRTIETEPFDFSINLSVEDMMNTHYTERLFELLNRERLGGVIIEIVESEGIENFEEVNRFIEKAKGLGCLIAIDDFGTGYSNFEYLIKLNADFLKIDGSLIKNIDTDEDAFDIVSTIVSFAQKKKIPVIAEFVSSEAIFKAVKKIGIEYAQGYYIGKPEAKLVDCSPLS
jgi:PAS domain S-box-containing protein